MIIKILWLPEHISRYLLHNVPYRARGAYCKERLGDKRVGILYYHGANYKKMRVGGGVYFSTISALVWRSRIVSLQEINDEKNERTRRTN
jgi:hypothetical protein